MAVKYNVHIINDLGKEEVRYALEKQAIEPM